jgi:hypothetical protein
MATATTIRRILAQAPPHVAPRCLRVQIGGDEMGLALAGWPGLARLEELEVAWCRGLSDEAHAALGRCAHVVYR